MQVLPDFQEISLPSEDHAIAFNGLCGYFVHERHVM